MKIHMHYAIVSNLAIFSVVTSVAAHHLPLFNE